jgi:hypothetical protein
MTRPIALAIALLGLAACSAKSEDSGSPPDSGSPTVLPDLSLLSAEGGCGDLFLYQVDPAGSLLLEARVAPSPSLGEQSAADGNAPASLTVDLASEPAVTLSEGIDLDHLPCNDALEGTEEVRTTWSPVAGTATFTFTASGQTEVDRPLGEGQVELEGVVLEAPDGTQLSVPDRSWTAAAGWLPG